MQYLYIISTENHAPCKIGFGNNPKLRLKQIQIGNPAELQLYAAIPFASMKSLESGVHEMLAGFHIRGEWFDIEPAAAIAAAQYVASTLGTERLQIIYCNREPDLNTERAVLLRFMFEMNNHFFDECQRKLQGIGNELAVLNRLYIPSRSWAEEWHLYLDTQVVQSAPRITDEEKARRSANLKKAQW